MIDLNIYFKSRDDAEDELFRLAHEIKNKLDSGDQNDIGAALAMEPALIEAEKKYNDLDSLCKAMKRANNPQEQAKIAKIYAAGGKFNQREVVTREVFDRLSALNRSRFLRDGGILED